MSTPRPISEYIRNLARNSHEYTYLTRSHSKKRNKKSHSVTIVLAILFTSEKINHWYLKNIIFLHPTKGQSIVPYSMPSFFFLVNQDDNVQKQSLGQEFDSQTSCIYTANIGPQQKYMIITGTYGRNEHSICHDSVCKPALYNDSPKSSFNGLITIDFFREFISIKQNSQFCFHFGTKLNSFQQCQRTYTFWSCDVISPNPALVFKKVNCNWIWDWKKK